MPRRDPEAPWQEKEIPFDLWDQAVEKVIREEANDDPPAERDAGNAHDFSSEPLVRDVYKVAEFMAILRQGVKGQHFQELGRRLAGCFELLGGPSALEPDWEIQIPAGSRPKQRPLPSESSPEFRAALKAQVGFQKQATTPVQKPKRGRPKKHAGSPQRQAAYRRRRDGLATLTLEKGELHRIVQDDIDLLSVIDRHVEDLEGGGFQYQLNAAVIRRACQALAAGRLELARLIESETSKQEAAVVAVGSDG